MSTAENKALNRAVFEALSRHDVEQAAENWNADCKVYGFAPQMLDREGLKHVVTMYYAAFPDLQFIIEDEIAEGEKVVTRYIARGTQTGEFMGIPATNKHMETSGTIIAQIVDGKTVALWDNLDTLGMLQQLGVIPAPGQPATSR